LLSLPTIATTTQANASTTKKKLNVNKLLIRFTILAAIIIVVWGIFAGVTSVLATQLLV
jgi:hypothetical protein